MTLWPTSKDASLDAREMSRIYPEGAVMWRDPLGRGWWTGLPMQEFRRDGERLFLDGKLAA